MTLENVRPLLELVIIFILITILSPVCHSSPPWPHPFDKLLYFLVIFLFG